MIDCPKCGAEQTEGAVECARCGVFLARATSVPRPTRPVAPGPVEPVPASGTSWTKILIIALMVGLAAFGVWQWMNPAPPSDLDKLNAEVMERGATAAPIDGGRTENWLMRRGAKLAIVLLIFMGGYVSWKQSMSS